MTLGKSVVLPRFIYNMERCEEKSPEILFVTFERLSGEAHGASAQNFCPDCVEPLDNTASIACGPRLVMAKNFITPSRTFALLSRA